MEVDPDSGLSMEELVARKRELNRERMRRWREKKRLERQNQLALGLNFDEMQAKIERDREKARERARQWREKKKTDLSKRHSPETLEAIMNDKNERDRERMQQWRDKKRSTGDPQSVMDRAQQYNSEWLQQYLQMANGMAMMNGYSPLMGGATPMNPMLPTGLPPPSLASSMTTPGHADISQNGHQVTPVRRYHKNTKSNAVPLVESARAELSSDKASGEKLSSDSGKLEAKKIFKENKCAEEMYVKLKLEYEKEIHASGKMDSSKGLLTNDTNSKCYTSIKNQCGGKVTSHVMSENEETRNPLQLLTDVALNLSRSSFSKMAEGKQIVSSNRSHNSSAEHYQSNGYDIQPNGHHSGDEAPKYYNPTPADIREPGETRRWDEHGMSMPVHEAQLASKAPNTPKCATMPTITTTQPAVLSQACSDISKSKTGKLHKQYLPCALYVNHYLRAVKVKSFVMDARANMKTGIVRVIESELFTNVELSMDMVGINKMMTQGKQGIMRRVRKLQRYHQRHAKALRSIYKRQLNLWKQTAKKMQRQTNATHSYTIHIQDESASLEENQHATRKEASPAHAQVSGSMTIPCSSTCEQVSVQDKKLIDISPTTSLYDSNTNGVFQTTNTSSLSNCNTHSIDSSKHLSASSTYKQRHNSSALLNNMHINFSESIQRAKHFPYPHDQVSDSIIQSKDYTPSYRQPNPNEFVRSPSNGDDSDSLKNVRPAKKRSIDMIALKLMKNVGTKDCDETAIKEEQKPSRIQDDQKELDLSFQKRSRKHAISEREAMQNGLINIRNHHMPKPVSDDDGERALSAVLNKHKTSSNTRSSSNSPNSNHTNNDSIGNSSAQTLGSNIKNVRPNDPKNSTTSFVEHLQKQIQQNMWLHAHLMSLTASMSPSDMAAFGAAAGGTGVDPLAQQHILTQFSAGVNPLMSSMYNPLHAKLAAADSQAMAAVSHAANPFLAGLGLQDDKTRRQQDSMLMMAQSHALGASPPLSGEKALELLGGMSKAKSEQKTLKTEPNRKQIQQEGNTKFLVSPEAKSTSVLDPTKGDLHDGNPSTRDEKSCDEKKTSTNSILHVSAASTPVSTSDPLHQQHIQMMQYYYYQQQLQLQASQQHHLQAAAHATIIPPEYKAQQDKREKARIQMRKYRAKKKMETDSKGECKPLAEADTEKRKLNAERMRRWREKKRIQATLAGHQAALGFPHVPPDGSMSTTGLPASLAKELSPPVIPPDSKSISHQPKTLLSQPHHVNPLTTNSHATNPPAQLPPHSASKGDKPHQHTLPSPLPSLATPHDLSTAG